MRDAANLPDSAIGSAPQPVTTGSTQAKLPRRDTLLILVSIALITALAWLYLIHLDRQMARNMAQDQMMAAMGMPINGAWTLADLFFSLVMWAVMMVGMMGPSAAPMVLVFAAAQSGRGGRRVSLSAGSFGLGYVFVWTVFSAGAAVSQLALQKMAVLSSAMAALSPRIGGAVLIAAGLYQMTPWKDACLTHCRSPLSFLMTHWRDGRWGAFQIGARHGVYCLGCCWALMIILFVSGVMNLVWVAGLAALVLLEKVAPYGTDIARVSGAALAVYGIVLIV